MNLSKVLIVSHDAGGAYLLSKWCRDWMSRIEFSFYLSGPAVDIFKHAIPSIKLIGDFDWDDFTQLIASTGWQTDFEKQAIYMAKKNDIYAVSYLDHWANYADRFIYQNNMVYPDEIWVADDYAMTIARNTFDSKVSRYRKIRNRHFSQIKSDLTYHDHGNSVLICLEPIRSSYSLSEAYEVLIKFLLTHLDSRAKIIIRDHPSNTETQLDSLAHRISTHFNVSVSSAPLEQDLSCCSVVIGYQSSVLAYAVDLGKETYSFYPSNKMEPILPHLDITYISTLSSQKVDI